MKYMVAMSGGVDSSVTAARLLEHGHAVEGVTMRVFDPVAGQAKSSPPWEDAQRVCAFLGIPWRLADLRELVKRRVIDPFVHSYLSGATPNPCVECNHWVKFGALLELAREAGADRLATGHYARIDRQAAQPRLLRGVDRHKDQSYFLYRLDAVRLTQIEFPLGDLTKAEVRAWAREGGLPVADKGESQEICFLSGRPYVEYLEQVGADAGKPGRILGPDQSVLGSHAGIHRFTLGQRRGLGIAAPRPLYVIGIDPSTGDVRVGFEEDLSVTSTRIEQVLWTAAPPSVNEVVGVQQRYREPPKPARLRVGERGAATIEFCEPVTRAASGQAAVVYRGDEVLGGGTIAASPCSAKPKQSSDSEDSPRGHAA